MIIGWWRISIETTRKWHTSTPPAATPSCRRRKNDTLCRVSRSSGKVSVAIILEPGETRNIHVFSRTQICFSQGVFSLQNCFLRLAFLLSFRRGLSVFVGTCFAESGSPILLLFLLLSNLGRLFSECLACLLSSSLVAHVVPEPRFVMDLQKPSGRQLRSPFSKDSVGNQWLVETPAVDIL